MSSTNRGGTRSPADYYATPAWAVRRLMEHLRLPGGRWLEPAAGDGAIIRAVQRNDVEWSAWELREQQAASLAEVVPPDRIHIGDFLSPQPPAQSIAKQYGVAITNPPYRLAREFIEACLPLADIVVMLLRLNFLASKERHELMRANTPAVLVLPNRPSFTNGGTDSIEYAWFVWGLDADQQGRVTVLDLTPSDERRASAPRSKRARTWSTGKHA